jgi:hypothetical protein
MTGWRQVDDREASETECNSNRLIDPQTGIVGAAMAQTIGHHANLCSQRVGGLAPNAQYSSQSAHFTVAFVFDSGRPDWP